MKRIVASLTLASLAYALMQMMVVPALPAIQRDLGAGPDATAWLISAFLLSTTIATPVLGRIGDVHGKERVLVAVLALFGLGSAVGALAPSLPWLIVARVLQGLGGAVFPLAYGLARDALPAARVPLAIGVVSGSFGVGGSVGLVIGGPLVDGVSWHAIFWLGTVLPVVAIVCVRLFVPRSPPRGRVALDWTGVLLLTAGMLPLLLAISRLRAWGPTSPAAIGCVLASASLLACFVRWELRRREPLVDMRLLRDRTVWTADVAALLVGCGMYANGFLLPLFVQADPGEVGFGFGASVTGASLFLLPASIGGMLAGLLAGWLGGRRGSKLPLVLGTATMAAGFALLAFEHSQQWHVYLGATLAHGIGLNLSYTALSNLVIGAVPAAQTGEAAGMNTMLRTLGGAFGSQVAGALVAAAALHGGLAPATGFTLAFVSCGVLLCAAAALALSLPRDRRRSGAMVRA